jgi:hypothetical protein
MRPLNKRSRSKQNRPRTLGNIVNRVFDSSGPEGKVRGTPQQIIDKYLVLARDAQLSGDRVAAENFLQHAEHYQRMLNEAQAELAREAEARREQFGSQPGQNRRFEDRDGDTQTADRREERGERPNFERRDDRGDRPQGDRPQGDRREERSEREGRMDWLGRRHRRFDHRPRGEGDGRGIEAARGPDSADRGETDGESLLVETPESRAERLPEPRPAAPPAAPSPAEAPAPVPAEATARPQAQPETRPPRRQDRPAPEAAAQAPAEPGPPAGPAAAAVGSDARRNPRRRRAAAGAGTEASVETRPGAAAE